MDKMLAVVFDEEKAAYEGARALSDLNAEGSVAVNAVAVIKKNVDGTISTRRVDGDFPIQTFAGTAIGSVIGILGGPVGIAAGSAAGALAGLIGDLYTSGVDTDFLSDVSSALIPGKCAVVADVEEDWVTPVDTRMEAIGGVVYRTLKTTVEDDHWSRQARAARAELDQLKIEHAQVRADRKAKLQAQIESLTQRADTTLQRAQERARQVNLEFQTRLGALQEKAQREEGDAKAALDARIARLRSDYQKRIHA